VRGNTASAQPADAGVVRVDENTGRGVAVATDCNARFVALDPYTGAQPLAVTDCLNFGSPEDPGVMWQFAEATSGLKDGCAVLGIPVTGGNVSFYNQTGDVAILPTPVVGVLGVIDDVRQRVTKGFRTAGEHVILLGETADEFSGSTWADVIHDHLGGKPPAVDFAGEQALAGLLQSAARAGLLSSAHDLSDGGLAVTLVESALSHDVGVSVDFGDEDPFVQLFSESTARALVTVAEDRHEAFVDLAESAGVPLASIGLTGGDALSVTGPLGFTVSLADVRADWSATLPAVLGPTLS
jgi:phosphoribosylformylglycinamidine synthase